MADWQPIASAPRGMVEIIGIDGRGFVARTWHFAPSSRTNGWLRMGMRGNAWWQPTHWQPLPPPPLTAEGE